MSPVTLGNICLSSSSSSDCGVKSCPDFYEWNARSQLTTWNPTPAGASSVPPGPVDYASKHWSGLISDYYAERAKRIMGQAVSDANAGRPLNEKACAQIEADLAHQWQNSNKPYPVVPVTSALSVSRKMILRYSSYFSRCFPH